MPEFEGVTPSGYDDAAASSLEQGALADAQSKAFYQQFPNSTYGQQYNPVEYDEIEGNPEDPAGYDDTRQVLTVMFRDGTLFNFYNVTPGEWKTFQSSYSKGPLLNFYNKGQYSPGFLLTAPHSYGPADVSNVSPEVLSTIYRVARSSQFRYASNRGTVYRTAQGKAYIPPKSKKGAAPKNNPPASRPHRPHKP
jgi:hypothetical protein